VEKMGQEMRLGDDITTAIIFLEEYDCDLQAQNRGEPVTWETHEEGARELLNRLTEVQTSDDSNDDDYDNITVRYVDD
jgi:hypothetical protein